MDTKNLTYAQAMEELEDIVEKIENNEMDIDNLTDELKRAQELVKFCRERLLKTEEEVNKILSSDDLKGGATSVPGQINNEMLDNSDGIDEKEDDFTNSNTRSIGNVSGKGIGGFIDDDNELPF